MFNRKKLAVPSVLLASVLFLSAGVTQAAYANDASGSEEVSVEATKETPAEAPAEETKKAEELPAAPAKDMQTAPVGDPVVAPAPLVEPAPAPAVPEPAAPAPAPAEPKVETPVAPAAPDAPVASLVPDVAIDNPAPSTTVVEPAQDAPTVEEEIPPACEPSWDVYLNTFYDVETLPGWGTFLTGGTITCGVAGASYGDYTLVLANATFYPEGGSVGHIGALKTSDGKNFDSANLFWKCAKEGASYSLVDNTTGLSVTGVVPLPGGVDAGDSRCGTTTPVQQVVEVKLSELIVVQAGENKAGSITQKDPVTGATLVCDPANAIQGTVTCRWELILETPEVKYVFANENDGKPFKIELGEYSESVPNPGIYPAYSDHSLTEQGVGTLTPLAPFNQKDSVGLSLSGTSKVDGSVVTVAPVFQDTLGLAPVVVQVDLSQFCGLVKYFWMTQTVTPTSSSQAILFPGAVTLPACDPQGGDDGGDNENPNPNPDPSHPGHGHDHDGDHDHDCDWWHDNCNGHAGGPGFNGPTTTPGDLANNDVTDSSVNPSVVQSSSSESYGLGNTLPDVSEWSADYSSDTEGLPDTGFNPRIIVVAILGLILGTLLFVGSRRRETAK